MGLENGREAYEESNKLIVMNLILYGYSYAVMDEVIRQVENYIIWL